MAHIMALAIVFALAMLHACAQSQRVQAAQPEFAARVTTAQEFADAVATTRNIVVADHLDLRALEPATYKYEDEQAAGKYRSNPVLFYNPPYLQTITVRVRQPVRFVCALCVVSSTSVYLSAALQCARPDSSSHSQCT